jgi:hypothetical protein
LCFYFGFTSAQTYSFDKIIDYDSTYNFISNPLVYDCNTSVAIQSYAYSQTQKSGYIFTVFDSLGNIGYSKNTVFDSLFVIGPSIICENSDNYIYAISLVGNPKDSNYYNQLIKYNRNGDILFSKLENRFRNNLGDNYSKLISTNDGKIVAIGTASSGNGITSHILFTVFDDTGKILVRTNVSNNKYCTGQDIVECSNGEFILVGTVDDYNTSALYTHYNYNGISIIVEKIDEGGNIFWFKKIEKKNIDEGACSIIKLKNSTKFLVSGYSQFIDSIYISGLYFHSDISHYLMIDDTGKIIWEKNLDALESFVSQSVELDDGNFVSLGTIGSQFRIIKLSSIGDSLCTFKLNITDSLNVASNKNIASISDCSFLISNTINYHSNFPDAEFSRINFSNCNQIKCNVIQNSNEALISIFPNPCHEKINIYINNTDIKYSCEMYSLLGQIFLSKELKTKKYEILNIDNIPSGIYFLKIISEIGDVNVYKIIKE